MLRDCLNRLLVDSENAIYWTVTREPKARKAPYTIHQARKTARTVGNWPYQHTVDCGFPEFQPLYGPMSERDAENQLQQWNLRPVQPFNGYPEAHAALVAEAERRNLPTHYKNDLYIIDKIELTSPAYASDDFLWCLRTCGTHIVKLDSAHVDLSSGNRPTQLVKAIGNMGDPEHYWYIYRDGRLRQIDYDRAMLAASEAEMRKERH